MLAPFFCLMNVVRQSGCKINLLLNVLGRRPDGFHELETVMAPVRLYDTLEFSPNSDGVGFTCSDASLPTDGGNLVVRAAEAFRVAAGLDEGATIHLEKRIPAAAGLGGGSGNAAAALLGLNEIFEAPLSMEELGEIARGLGSDVPFFLDDKPALAVGRGEQVELLEPFDALNGAWLLLVRPGFGVATPWAYRALADFPDALNGQPGRARDLVEALRCVDLKSAAGKFYNSLEAPVLRKFPILAMYGEFLWENGAVAALMSGSGSTTFAIAESQSVAEELAERFKGKFGESCWLQTLPV
ncbi:MAG: 4-diphosphocytidyl-2-C-methyl-D-erythritol kinase [Candidatus Binatia bacterium]|jgi:4-diphosphocytidyl-2-C-methyl-D-erythritol kinase